jgi:hypothetical protein
MEPHHLVLSRSHSDAAPAAQNVMYYMDSFQKIAETEEKKDVTMSDLMLTLITLQNFDLLYSRVGARATGAASK